MAIVKMKKLTVAVIDNLRDQLLKELQVLGAVHIDVLNVEKSEEGVTAADTWVENLNTISSDFTILEDYRKEIAMAIGRVADICNKSVPSFEITSFDVMNKVQQKYEMPVFVNQLRDLDRKTRDSETALGILKTELDQIVKWSSGVDDFAPIHGNSKVLKGMIGHIAESSFDDLCDSLFKATDLVDVISCWTQDKEVYCYIVADPSVWDTVYTILKEKPFNNVQVTRRSGSANKIIKDLNEEISNTQAILNQAIEEWHQYASQLEELALLHDFLEIQIQQLKASSLALSTECVNFLKIWVPEEYMPKVEAILSIHNKSIDVMVEDPTEEEYTNVPVLLKNNSLTKPFASLTNMYGTPMYGKTVDPTPHLSLFYFIYYGICLGDALYGAVLALFSLYMMLKNRSNEGMYNFLALLAWSGFSAVIAGVLFGSYAGDLFSKYIPIPALVDFRFTFSDGAGFFDKPLFVLFISLLLGAVQLWYGYWLKFFISLKNNGIEAFFNEMPWIILLAGFFGWAVFSWIGGMAGLTLVSSGTVTFLFLLMQIGAGLVIVNNIRMGLQKGLVAGILGPLAGAWELYGLSGYLSNLLSYARLLALGLSSGIIANVFNKLGFDVINVLVDITPILGVFGAIILVFLHIFNLVLGGFGAFVHALRLQFVEFFGQFIEGGGKDFTPLIRKGTHYTVK